MCARKIPSAFKTMNEKIMDLYSQVVKERDTKEAVLKNMAEGVMSLDENLVITSFNESAEKITGWKAKDVINKKCHDVFKGVDSESGLMVCTPAACFLYNAMKKGENSCKYFLRLRAGERNERFVEFNGRFLKNGALKYTGAVIVFRDMSAVKALEDLKSELISTVSHELKTPLTSIKSYMQLLLHPKADFDIDKIKEILKSVSNAADRLDRCIGDLLYASRVKSNQLVLNLKHLNLAALVKNIMDNYKGKIPKHSFTLNVSENLEIMADKEQMEYVVSHLISNAIKYSPGGGEILIGAKKTDGHAGIFVQDQGVGIPQKHLKKIFDLFHRVDMSNARFAYGSGVGLFIVKKIVEVHGGKIWAENIEGNGSRFTFTIPS